MKSIKLIGAITIAALVIMTGQSYAQTYSSSSSIDQYSPSSTYYDVYGGSTTTAPSSTYTYPTSTYSFPTSTFDQNSSFPTTTGNSTSTVTTSTIGSSTYYGNSSSSTDYASSTNNSTSTTSNTSTSTNEGSTGITTPTVPEQPTSTAGCISAATSKRESIVYGSFIKYTEVEDSALYTRRMQLSDAWQQSTAQAIRAAVNDAWSTYTRSHDEAVNSHNTETTDAWNTYKKEVNACKYQNGNYPIDTKGNRDIVR